MFDNAPNFDGIPKYPSELYLEKVRERKKPRGPYLYLVRPSPGRPGVAWSANLLKSARKAMAMAWLEARKLEAIPARNNGLRRLAASVLGAFMEVRDNGLGFENPPQRMVCSTQDYTHALQYYRFHIYSKRKKWQQIPGAPNKPA